MKRSKFSLSNTKLFTGNMGNLIPCGLTHVNPGDSIQQATTVLLRFSPLLSPVMHTTHCQIAHWFVPHRLVWDDWEDFITGGEDGISLPVYPTITTPPSTGVAVSSLADYLGVPTGVPDREYSALPTRGYNLIWNEWYRDQDLQDPQVIDTTSGPDTTTNNNLLRAAWEKDYFTSSRPFEQKGPSITIPLGTTAPVKGTGGPTQFRTAAGDARSLYSTSGQPAPIWDSTPGQTGVRFFDTNNTGLQTDLSGASSITISRLREAFALQRFAEARARYGSRYVEYLRYLGVRSSDARLQRPEFLGGGRYPVQFSEVLQTAEGTNPVGELRGHGIGVARSNRYRRFFEEHGYVFTFCVVKPKTIYMQGLPRHFNYRTREDFWQEELQHIGQQEVLNKEVYLGHASPDGTFGFANRYQEYRETPNTISGQFRTSELDFWHFGRQWTSAPALNASFVECVPPETPFAVPSEDVLWARANHSIQARRLVSGSAKSFIY